MAAAPDVPTTPLLPTSDLSSSLDNLPTTKVHKLIKDLSSRGVVCEAALTPTYPEYFHTLNLDNFDTETLCALFYDVVPAEERISFLHFMQAGRLSFRLTRGPKDLALNNIGSILGRMRLFTVLGKAGITLRPNEKLSADDNNWDYEDLPVSLPAAFGMFEQIKDDYTTTYPSAKLSDAVMEFSTKRMNGIWLKYVNPTFEAPAAPAPAAPTLAMPMSVDSDSSAIPKGSKKRSDPPPVVPTLAAPPSLVPAGKKRAIVPPKVNV